MSDPLTGQQVFKAYMQDPRAQEQPSYIHEWVRSYIESSPEVLAELLNQPLTLRTYLEAKILFLKYCLANGIVERTEDFLPVDDSLFFGMKQSQAMLKTSMESALRTFEKLFQETSQVTSTDEPIAKIGPFLEKVGLIPQLHQAYLAGTLTIREVLAMQPGILLMRTY